MRVRGFEIMYSLPVWHRWPPAPEDLTHLTPHVLTFIGRTTQLLKTKLQDENEDYSMTVPVTSAWYPFPRRRRHDARKCTMHVHSLTSRLLPA